MPKFTEGEWKLEKCELRWADSDGEYDGYDIVTSVDGGKQYLALDISRPFDARLIAQSKKMYEVIKEALAEYDSEDYLECIDFSWIDKMRAILSSIEEE